MNGSESITDAARKSQVVYTRKDDMEEQSEEQRAAAVADDEACVTAPIICPVMGWWIRHWSVTNILNPYFKSRQIQINVVSNPINILTYIRFVHI